MKNKQYGLIGYPLSHSFSKKYFTEKFAKEGIKDAEYELFELEHIENFWKLVEPKISHLRGLNVTIPHKEEVIAFLDEMDEVAEEIGAVNVIKISEDGILKGYNSDYYGFKKSLEKFVGVELSQVKALVLGTGGASKAVKKALKDLNIEFISVSRTANNDIISYEMLTDEMISTHRLIINTTPLGMYPKVDACPKVPYQAITNRHYLYDLVYNPEETLFMKKGKEKGAKTIHGLEMLIGQAEKAWEIWNEK